MPYSRLMNLTEEKRTRIMETALDEFIGKNFESASINQISKRAGLSAGALYYYFEDKEDLFYTTIEYATLGLWNELGDIRTFLSDIGFWKGIKSIVKKRLEFTLEHPKYMKLFHRILNSSDPIERRGKENFVKPFKDIFEYGYDNGFIRTDLPKELVFNMHLSMTLTVNKWSLEQELKEQYSDEELHKIIHETIEMIKSAVGKDVI